MRIMRSKLAYRFIKRVQADVCATPAAVAAMSAVQSGDLKTGFVDGMGWGLGCGVVRQPQGVTAMLSPGTFGHGGAYGTQA